jgi:hypothetical protein
MRTGGEGEGEAGGSEREVGEVGEVGEVCEVR